MGRAQGQRTMGQSEVCTGAGYLHVVGLLESLHEEPNQCCILLRRLFTSLVHNPSWGENTRNSNGKSFTDFTYFAPTLTLQVCFWNSFLSFHKPEFKQQQQLQQQQHTHTAVSFWEFVSNRDWDFSVACWECLTQNQCFIAVAIVNMISTSEIMWQMREIHTWKLNIMTPVYIDVLLFHDTLCC